MNFLEPLHHEYADRERRLAGSDIYSPFNRATLFTIQGRQRDVLGKLLSHCFKDLRQAPILELGCGHGGVLLE
jgi:hypothetical protein